MNCSCIYVCFKITTLIYVTKFLLIPPPLPLIFETENVVYIMKLAYVRP